MEQHEYPDLPRLEDHMLRERRERVFLVFAGLFLGTLAMLNILGISRFVNAAFLIPGSESWDLKFAIPIGVLPYPVTFLCTDFISEFWGRRRANFVVFMGLVVNLWLLLILWVGGVWPGFEPDISPNEGRTFFDIRSLAFAAITASMIAYFIAQFVDVQVFHFWKHVTKGRHLWLRNNGSTIVSQLVDTVAVTVITFGGAFMKGDMAFGQLMTIIGAGYAFKLLVAMLDTGPFYIGSHYLARYLRFTPRHLEMQRPQSP